MLDIVHSYTVRQVTTIAQVSEKNNKKILEIYNYIACIFLFCAHIEISNNKKRFQSQPLLGNLTGYEYNIKKNC